MIEFYNDDICKYDFDQTRLTRKFQKTSKNGLCHE